MLPKSTRNNNNKPYHQPISKQYKINDYWSYTKYIILAFLASSLPSIFHYPQWEQHYGLADLERWRILLLTGSSQSKSSQLWLLSFKVTSISLARPPSCACSCLRQTTSRSRVTSSPSSWSQSSSRSSSWKKSQSSNQVSGHLATYQQYCPVSGNSAWQETLFIGDQFHAQNHYDVGPQPNPGLCNKTVISIKSFSACKQTCSSLCGAHLWPILTLGLLILSSFTKVRLQNISIMAYLKLTAYPQR